MGYFGTVRDYVTGAPLSGLLVSDGRNSVRTDSEGKYWLPGWKRARLIYVNALTRKKDDWYLFITPERIQYDFRIWLAPECQEHTFLHLSDTEIGEDGCKPWLDFVRCMMKENNAVFLMHTGDLCRREGVMRHSREMNSETMGFPVRYAIGNHDFVEENYGEFLFERCHGPVWYSFDCGKVHYVVTSIQKGEAKSGYEEDDQWEWLKGDLSLTDPQKDVILFSHGSCREPEEFHFHTEERMRFLQKHRLKALVYGHYHVHSLQVCDDYLRICTCNPAFGGVDSSPAGIRLVHLTDTGEIESRILYHDESLFTEPQGFDWASKIPGRIQYSTPLVVGDFLFVGTVDAGSPKQCGVAKLDKQGQIIWFFQTEDGVENDMAASDGVLYFQDGSGNLYAVEMGCGTLLWKKRTQFLLAPDTTGNVVVWEDRVIAGTCNYLVAYDKGTGRLLWSFEHRKAGNPTPIRKICWKHLLIVGANWHSMYAVHMQSGELVWEMQPQTYRFFYATPLIVEDKLLVAAGDTVYVLDAATGKIQNEKCLKGVFLDVCGTPVKDNNCYYLSTVAHGIVALNSELELLQTYPCGGAMVGSAAYFGGQIATVEGSVLVEGERLYFSASDGYFYCYEKDTGELLNKRHVGAPSFVAPIRFGNSIIVASFAGNVIAFADKEEVDKREEELT